VYATIQSGDSLWTLARRHHTSVNHLRSLNPGLGDLLRIGKQMKVPANQLARANPLPNPLLSQGRRIRYKVRSGDSLWVIAQRFGTTTRDIARSNQISQTALIRPGDTLWIIARIRPS
jgi:membrane-bound lytic murein transglycosylase D